MIVFVANLSVSDAARRLGVNVARIHQRIADGSLRAERIGSQWVIDERSALDVAERRKAGRPLSARSAWAMIALSAVGPDGLRDLAPVERARARQRLGELMARVSERPKNEADVAAAAAAVRALFRNRAERRLLRSDVADLEDVRHDSRWQGRVDAGVSGIASGDVEGYLGSDEARAIAADFLLVDDEARANVVVHVLPPDQRAYDGSKLQLAVDLAEHRGPREEARAVELLYELAHELNGADR